MAHKRLEEKKELSLLTARFITYVRHVRQLKEEVDVDQIATSVSSMEDELKKMKCTYEDQIGKILNAIEIVSKEKQDLERQYTTKNSNEAQLLDRLQSAEWKNARFIQELAQMREGNARKEDEVKTMEKMSSRFKADFETLHEKHSRIEKLRSTLHAQLRQAEDHTAELQAKVNALEMKVGLAENHQGQTIRELREQLEAYGKRLSVLDASAANTGDKPDSQLAAVRQKIEEETELEKANFQKQTESLYSETLALLRNRLEESKQARQNLQRNNEALKREVQTINTKESQTQGELRRLRQEFEVAQQVLQRHREESTGSVQSLEERMRQMQQLMVEKLQEAQAQAQNDLSLQEEIDALKELLKKEEDRLHIRLTMQPNFVPSKSVVMVPKKSSPHPPPPPVTPVPQTITDNATYRNQQDGFVVAPPPSRLEAYEEDKTTRDSLNPAAVGPLCKPPPVPGYAPCEMGDSEACARQYQLGDSPDYFEVLFKHEKPARTFTPEVSFPMNVNSVATDLKLVEMEKDGKYARLANVSTTQDVELGGFFIQVNYGNDPVVIYRFSPYTKLCHGATVTVWSELGVQDAYVRSMDSPQGNLITLDEFAANALEQPPTSYTWRELECWPTGEPYTTILCRPDGQAISWINSSARPAYQVPAMLGGDIRRGRTTLEKRGSAKRAQLQGVTSTGDLLRQYLKSAPTKQKCKPPLRHPHTSVPREHHGNGLMHPHTDAPRLNVFGNDQSSHNRQTRIALSLSAKGRRDADLFTEPPHEERPRGPYTGRSYQAVGLVNRLKDEPTHNRAALNTGSDLIMRSNLKPPPHFM